jgi:hypothetical protein
VRARSGGAGRCFCRSASPMITNVSPR